ncbi:MAG: winged helix-turn-helix transcriptional regulator [Deltaproteobacteria bacterium]|uniref:Winged helix-turn-helix transcriptional regulator n=1 Tax=Candidatus Zymogenus saltonus TaxID=2844893 RepID=A0A9D8KIB0_9DELT|nr:winged helix-turn-helix transcriptional regulator [Candidatus Zymogenus saltonus]
MEFIQLLIRINEIVHASMRRFKEEIIGGGDYPEVTVNQLIYLEAIFQLGSPTVSELADHLKVSKASASVGIGKLIKSGLADKTISLQDRRIHHISLSGDGKRLIEAEVRALTEFSERVRGALSDDEAKVLIEIFKKILSNYNGSNNKD